MPLSLRRGRVTGILEQHDGLVRLEVDGMPCVAYPELTGPVALDDEVLVNSQARELELGSGGFDVLYANLTRGLGLPAGQGAHVIKLPYTPAQFAALHAEEGDELAAELDGMPVVCCSLHSQLAAACAGLGKGARVAYVQLEGGAFPLALSDTVRALQERGLGREHGVAGRVLRRRGRVRERGIGTSVGRSGRPRGGRLRCRARNRRNRARGSATAALRRPLRPTSPLRSAARPCSPCGSRAPTSGNGTAASRITRARWSSSAWAT